MDRLLGTDYATIVTPFTGGTPYGTSAQYSERYEAIQREIQKLTAASSLETSVDWKVVRKNSIDLLSKDSKDLSVACFLTVALFLESGYSGARDGLDIVRAFVGDHWVGIFPPVERAVRRANDLRWLVERLAPLVEDRKPKPDEVAHLGPMLEAATALGELSRSLLLEKAPGFGELIGSLRNHAAQTTSPAAASGTSPASPSGAPDTTGKPTSMNAESVEQGAREASTSPSEQVSAAHQPAPPSRPPAPPTPSPMAIAAGASAADVRSQIETMIKPLRDADPLSPVPYRLLRALKWDGVAGPSTEGKTRIPGPRATDLTAIQALLDAGNWSGLLDRSENFFKAGNVWLLDLQRFSVLCLENLDPRGADGPAAEAIKQATREVVQRIPALVACTYSDGLAFASDETKSWLNEISTTEGLKIGGMGASSGGQETPGLPAFDIERATQLLRKKRLTEGMEVLQRGIETAAGPRARFRARLDAATACLNANQATWARPMLEALQREAGALTFDSWEPAWAIQLYQLLAICYGRLAKSSKGEERRGYSTLFTEIMDVLCRLDMQAAAAIDEAI